MTPARKKRITTHSATFAATSAAAALGLACPGHVAFAQTGAPTNLPGLAATTDIFVGRDNPGPYELTWKKIPKVAGASAPVVIVDGKTLREGEFTVDFDKGVVTFTAPLKASSMARVDYGRDPYLSERNANPAAAPVTVPLLKAPNSSFQLTAVQNAGTPVAAVPAEKTRALAMLGAAAPPTAAQSQAMPQTTLVLGANNKMGLLGGGLTSQVYLSPHIKDAKGEDGIYDKSGLSLGYNRKEGRLALDAGFVRTGRDFAPALGKTLGMGDAAQQKRTLGAKYDGGKWMGVEYGQSEVRALTGASGATGQERMGLRLGGAGNAPTLNALRVEDTKTDAKGALTNVTTEKYDLAAKLGPTTSLTARMQQVTTDAPEEKQDAAAGELGLAFSTQSKNKSQAASVAYNESSKETAGGVEEKQVLQVKLQASPSLTLTAEQQGQVVTPMSAATADQPAQLDPSKAKESSMQTARAEIALLPGAKVVTGVRLSAVGEDRTAATEVTAQFGAGKGIELAQTVVNRSASEGIKDATLDLNTTRTAVAFRPAKTFTLTGSLTVNPEANGRVTEAKRQELGLKTRFGSLELGSGYALTELTALEGTPQAGEWSLTMGLTFNRATKLTGSYKDALLWGADEESKMPRGVRLYSLGLTHSLSSGLNFSMGGSVSENKQDPTAPDDIKAEAKFGVKF